MRAALVVLAVAAVPLVAATAGPGAPGASPCAPPLIGIGAIGEGANNTDLMPPTVGRLRILGLFVDFPDARESRNPAVQYADAARSVSQWYDTVSYGRLQIEIELFPRWLTLQHPTGYYYNGRVEDVFAEAVQAADPDVDFSQVDAVYLTPSSGPDGGWIAIAPDPIAADEKTPHAWGWNPLENAVHETGHVLGLPDLYVSGVPWSFYRWDVMAGGGRPSGLYAWHRWKLGWLDGAQIACLAGRGRVEATVTPVETPGGVKAVVVRSSSVAYVAEVRQRLAEDATICKTGVLVYEVDLSGTRRPIWLRAAHPDGSAQTGSCGGRWRAPFDLGRGQVSSVTAGGVRFQLMRKLPDGSYRIRASKTR
jgi:hypothetical protein